MAKFCKKLVEVEAEQWRPPDDAFDGMPIPPVPSDQLRVRRVWPRPWIKRYQIRAHGSWSWLRPYDWVIADQYDEFSPCKPHIFDATYEDAGGRKTFIRLTRPEIQSGLDRVRFAELLIRQLPEDHDGRNSWLLNYATPKPREVSDG